MVRSAVPNPANDLWVTRAENGAETLIPAIRDVIVSVDIEGKRILVRDVPGITEPDEQDATRTGSPPTRPMP